MKKVFLLISLLSLGTALWAQPKRPECVAPAKPGGGFDLTCRIAAEGLQPELKKPMRVTFMPGGGGATAYNLYATKKTRDGNAIVAFSSGSLLNIATGKFGKFDEKAVRFVAMAGADYGAYVVRSDSPWKTLADLVAQIKKDPQSVVVGSSGSVGSQDWMKVAMLFERLGLDTKKMRSVSFEGGGEAITNLLGGSIQLYAGDVSEMKAHLDDGSMRILAVLSEKRLPDEYASYPTAREQGYDIVWPILRGYYMGKGVPEEDYQFYVNAFRKAYSDPRFQKIRHDRGLFPLELTGDEFAQYVEKKVGEMRGLARSVGLIKAS